MSLTHRDGFKATIKLFLKLLIVNILDNLPAYA